MKILSIYRSSFSARVFATAALFIVIFSVVLTTCFILNERQSLRHGLIVKGTLITELLASNSRVGIFAENKDLIIPSVDTVLKDTEAVSASVFNVSGKLITEQTREFSNARNVITVDNPEQLIAQMRKSLMPLHTENDNTIEFWSPVTAYTGYTSTPYYFDNIQQAKPGRLVGYVRVVLSMKSLKHDIKVLTYKSILASLFFLFAGLATVYVFIRRILQPVRELTDSVRHIEYSDFPKKIPVLHTDEFGQLAESFNGMIDELQKRQEDKNRLENQLVHMHKMEAIGCLATDISRDFIYLINTFTSKIFVARNYLSPGHKAYEELDALRDTLEYARELSKKLADFSKNSTTFIEVQSLALVLKQALPLVTVNSPIKLNMLIDDNLRQCRFDKWQISRILGYVLTNAMEASPTDGTITIKATNIDISNHTHLKDGQYALISISDKGIGISPDNIEKIFTPFFTTKYKHYGLGLAVAFSIIKNHGGHIEAESKEGRGTAVNIYIPAN
ncbi:ATP-binding protein [Candidatus Magnetominusculus dajiuhuensis]|uniref:ATP-binding protein n=1 Tax=Candidatus Magnetominusculus dajiuhuensis TaxID=3137712 RepID=UPI003B4379AE